MNRRTLVRSIAGVGAVGLAGCQRRENDEQPAPEEESDEDDHGGELRVAVDPSFVGEDAIAGRWLAEAFESTYEDAELTWTVPRTGLDHYLERVRRGAEIDADVFFGLTTADLVAIDETLEAAGDGPDDDGTDADDSGDGGSDEDDSIPDGLFRDLDRDLLERVDRLRSDLPIDDPDDRVLPYATNHVGLCYDDAAVSPPATLQALLEPEYDGTVLVSDPRTAGPGRSFLLWTVDAFGEDYLEFWRRLDGGGLRVTDRWADARESYRDGDRSVLVGYASERLAARRDDRDVDRYRIAFPDGRGYATAPSAAVFAQSERLDLAHAFLDFLLTSEIQTELVDRGFGSPAIGNEYVDRPDVGGYPPTPDESVALGYDDLEGDLEEWLEAWASIFA